MPGSASRLARAAVLVLAGLVVGLVAGVLIGRFTAAPASTPAGGSTSPVPSIRSSDPSGATPSGPTSSGPTSSATSAAGDAVLAAAGDGPRTLSFRPAHSGWTLHVTARCTQGRGPLQVTVTSAGQVVARVAGDTSDIRVPTAGAQTLTITGDCPWQLRAQG